jgi:thiol-disulfide isomerase/thioredoxin
LSTRRALTLGGAAAALIACGGERTTTATSSTTPPAAPPVADAANHLDPATACAALRPAPTNPVLGAFPRAAAPLVGTDVGGGAFDLASLRGKVVLVSFAASWDTLTKAERPTFDALATAIGDELAIVRVVSEEETGDFREERARADALAGTRYPTVWDSSRTCSALGVITNSWGVKAVPESFLVDRAGNVRFYFVNKRDWSTPEAQACVRAMVADTTPPIAVPPLGATAPEECPPPPPATLRDVGGDEGVSGTITFAASVKRKAKPGVIFVLVKQADASGQATGMPLAVDRLAYDGKALPFVLDKTKRLVTSGPAIVGDVVITARWDQDGDAMSKEPGDIIGTLRTTAPATRVKLVLDTVLP